MPVAQFFRVRIENKRKKHISDYLVAYCDILDYLTINQECTEWLQLFVLSHLDCVVHWTDDRSGLTDAFFLIGPWHPLVLAKRFMVQAALYYRAERALDKSDHIPFRRLASLLARISGFRWFVGVAADIQELEAMYVTVTSDPGWHLVFKRNCNSLAKDENVDGITQISHKLQHNIGLATETIVDASENLPVMCISNFQRAFPSRRSIGLRIPRGFVAEQTITAVDSYLHGDLDPTTSGLKMSGGVRLYFESELTNVGETRGSEDPPIYIYRFADIAECIEQEHPEIVMMPPPDELSFRKSDESFVYPRGIGLETVFSQPLNWLAEGKTSIPQSVTYESDLCENTEHGIGGAFSKTLTKISRALKEPSVTISPVDLTAGSRRAVGSYPR